MNKYIAVLLSILILLTGNTVCASQKKSSVTPEIKSQSTQDVQTDIKNRTDKSVSEQRHKILAEANAAIIESRKALKALDEGKTDAAIKSLELTIGKMALIVAREPELALAKVDVNVKVYDVYANAATLKNAVKLAAEYLEDGKVQLARPLVASLASEIVIESINIPLATYPSAIKAVVPLIDQGKIKEAKASLQAALNTLVVVEEEVIPLPVLRAQNMFMKAEKLAENKERSVAENKELETLLNEAETQLKIAEVLGYGNRDTFQPIYKQLKNIAKKTEDGNSGTGLFDRIKEQLSKIFS